MCKIFYENFGTFKEQSSKAKKEISISKEIIISKNINNNIKDNIKINLNSKDFWNYIIVYSANKNLNFKRNYYELKSGFNKEGEDKGLLNFYQLITNLLPDIEINDWSDKNKLLSKLQIINKDITSVDFIEPNNNDYYYYYGGIKISKNLDNLTIRFQNGHYSSDYKQPQYDKNNTIENYKLSEIQSDLIKYLQVDRTFKLNEIDIKNLLFYNYKNDNISEILDRSNYSLNYILLL
jgi:hypothetical protein